MSEWINVKDRLPDRNESILLVYDGKEIRKNIWYHVDPETKIGNFEQEYGMDYYGPVKFNVTHWMPLPKEPDL